MTSPLTSGKVKPITVSEAERRSAEAIPDIVIEGFNTLIGRKYDRISKSAKITLAEALDYISAAMAAEFGIAGATISEYRRSLLDNHWMDVEDIFRAAGWQVHFDKPAYNESYESYYEFSKP